MQPDHGSAAAQSSVVAETAVTKSVLVVVHGWISMVAKTILIHGGLISTYEIYSVCHCTFRSATSVFSTPNSTSLTSLMLMM